MEERLFRCNLDRCAKPIFRVSTTRIQRNRSKLTQSIVNQSAEDLRRHGHTTVYRGSTKARKVLYRPMLPSSMPSKSNTPIESGKEIWCALISHPHARRGVDLINLGSMDIQQGSELSPGEVQILGDQSIVSAMDILGVGSDIRPVFLWPVGKDNVEGRSQTCVVFEPLIGLILCEQGGICLCVETASHFTPITDTHLPTMTLPGQAIACWNRITRLCGPPDTVVGNSPLPVDGISMADHPASLSNIKIRSIQMDFLAARDRIFQVSVDHVVPSSIRR